MTHAYDELYLAHAQTVIGGMLEYAVHGLQMQLAPFYGLFLATGIADRFGSGEAKLLAGTSGVEMTHLVLDTAGVAAEAADVPARFGRSPEYWTGWVVAFYQWINALPFKKINEKADINSIRGMYAPYHEMDVRQFTDALDGRCRALQEETMLARLRRYAEMSQSMLAARSGVPVRTIQQYEQRQKDIARAGADNLDRLARALHTSPEILAG